MSQTITGIVTNGVIVPSSPIPEGTQVEIQVRHEFTPEERAEFESWQQGSAEALALAEALADQEQAHEKR